MAVTTSPLFFDFRPHSSENQIMIDIPRQIYINHKLIKDFKEEFNNILLISLKNKQINPQLTDTFGSSNKPISYHFDRLSKCNVTTILDDNTGFCPNSTSKSRIHLLHLDRGGNDILNDY
jgi:hypothetical protein